MKALQQWSLKWYLHSNDLEAVLQAKVLFRFSLVFVCITLLILGCIAVIPSPPPAGIIPGLILNLLLFALPIGLLRWEASFRVAGKVFILSFWVSWIIQSIFTGFPLHPAVPIWAVSLLLVADLLLGRRWSIGIAVLSSVVLAGAGGMYQLGIAIPSRDLTEYPLDLPFTVGVIVINLWLVLHILKQHRTVHRDLQQQTLQHQEQLLELLQQQHGLNLDLKDANVEAQAAALAKAQFLSTMSHEIRTPMNAVIGMTSLLMDTELSEEQRGFVDTVRLSGENLLSIINDILDFSKIEAGKMELEAHPFQVIQSVEDSLDLLSGKATEKGLELMYFVDPDVPQVIESDITRLRQVLVNLINNAIKFTDQGEIFVRAVSKGLDLGKHQIEFEVRDTGIGIPPDRLNRLFQSFSQVDATTTRKYGGTGLGLAISKRLVEMMGGTIWVESEAGTGSSFFFTIQAPEAFDVDLPVPNEVPKELIGGKILVVDDNRTNLQILEAQTRKWGFEPILANSAFEADQVLDRMDDIQLMILDCQMPQKDGLTFAREVRQKKSKTELPILMLTSLGLSLSQHDRPFIDSYLHKPTKTSQLERKVLDLLMKNERVAKAKLSTNEEDLLRFAGLSLLVVEDNLINQKVAVRMLKKLGLEADVASDGRQAIEALEKQSYDLLLMDMQMPVMDGISATREIRSRREALGDPIIIAMTANAFKDDKEACLAAGMNDYLSKPVRKEDLKEKLAEWFQPKAMLVEEGAAS
ncbi:MAG: response regulator [Bacteroidota bacterium]